ncbi:hypothetical protein LWI29_005965 [Acer saccharum]|uniref:Transmembrane protein n=1 Tax=Acer saccharum TaxID=4024 RepID=A0AA39SBJ1_ACESA|nr:hypothetical protein LWI29_005965 [Acer saccharum]
MVVVMVLGGGGNGGGLKIWIWLNDDEKPVMKWVGVVCRFGENNPRTTKVGVCGAVFRFGLVVAWWVGLGLVWFGYGGGGSGTLVGEFRLGLDLGFCLVLDGDGGGVARDGDGCLVGEKSGFLF